jgi:hypothetical protein
MTDFSEFKVTFDDVIDSACKRPELYTVNATFGEVLALLDGYAYGARLGRRGRSSSYFFDFAKWLSSRMGPPGNATFWRFFRESYPDDKTALSEFRQRWHEFAQEQSV